jgi:hypothetical protein
VVGQGNGADHRVNALLITHPEWVPEPWLACPGSCLKIAGFTCIRTALASLQDATLLSSANRWSFPPATLERSTGYLLPTLRVGLAIGK